MNISGDKPKTMLTVQLCDLLDEIELLDDEKYPVKYKRLLNKAKKMFQGLRIENMDFYGFWDLYASYKNFGK
ncbi:hypothetical protein GW796_05710 [archaeon]|nr:hypothetical protein [archaeon]NCQ51380.1 hypothetical protein [archaeon]NCT58794.1 hypothetical protein [archaeon]